MNNSIYTKIIHLSKREDRLSECNEELKKINILKPDGIYFEAKNIPTLGAKGCALSHAMALSEFLFKTEDSFALILEDDFSIREPSSFWTNLETALGQSHLWDVFLLGSNLAVPIQATPVESFFRVINSQTASGYLLRRGYAPKLIECFFRSAELLSSAQELPSPNKEIATHIASCDQMWKELQIIDRFWFSTPSIIYQRESYSDIVNTKVNYGT